MSKIESEDLQKIQNSIKTLTSQIKRLAFDKDAKDEYFRRQEIKTKEEVKKKEQEKYKKDFNNFKIKQVHIDSFLDELFDSMDSKFDELYPEDGKDGEDGEDGKDDAEEDSEDSESSIESPKIRPLANRRRGGRYFTKSSVDFDDILREKHGNTLILLKEKVDVFKSDMTNLVTGRLLAKTE